LKAKPVILVMLCIAILAAGARVVDWSLLRRWQAKHTSSRILWKQTLPSALASSPALGRDGSIYIATRSGSVYGLDRSGNVRWTYRPGLDEMPNGLLLDDEDNLYFSTQRRVLSLTASGKKRWEIECAPAKNWHDQQAGALGDGVVHIVCGENLIALNTADGRELWREPVFEWEALPVVLGSKAVVSTRTWSLVTVDGDGNPMWNFPPPNYVPPVKRPGLVTDDPFFSSPIAVGTDDVLYMGSGDGELSAFASDGTLKWTHDFGALRGIRFDSSPVIADDGTVIAVSNHATVYALAPDGTLRWFYILGDPILRISQPSPVLGSDGTIYVLTATKLAALSLAGSKLWHVTLPADADVSPTLAPDGTLYIATTDGLLSAVQTGSRGLMSSAWPKYQHDAANSGRASTRPSR
jgi:outer membrane protein assembly factor BamB